MKDTYTIVTFPDVQELMEIEGFDENSHLINDDPLLSKVGSSAYFVNSKWLDDVNKYVVYILKERNGEYEYIHSLTSQVTGTKSDVIKHGEHLAETFYENLSWVDYDLYYFNGGEVAVRYYSHKIITKEEFDFLNYIK